MKIKSFYEPIFRIKKKSGNVKKDIMKEKLIVGKWTLSPSGRIAFSVKENGIVERYSAEVRTVLYQVLSQLNKLIVLSHLITLHLKFQFD